MGTATKRPAVGSSIPTLTATSDRKATCPQISARRQSSVRPDVAETGAARARREGHREDVGGGRSRLTGEGGRRAGCGRRKAWLGRRWCAGRGLGGKGSPCAGKKRGRAKCGERLVRRMRPGRQALAARREEERTSVSAVVWVREA